MAENTHLKEYIKIYHPATGARRGLESEFALVMCRSVRRVIKSEKRRREERAERRPAQAEIDTAMMNVRGEKINHPAL